MNSQAISGSETHFLLNSKYYTCSKLGAFPFISHLSFNKNNTNHVTKQRVSFRNPSLFRLIKAAAGASVYAPAAPVKESLYELLGISESVSPLEIKKAYKQMALKYHPDVSPPDRAEEYTTKFIRVQEAYETLSDPEARAMYDHCMANGLPFGVSGRNGSGLCNDMGGWKSRWQVQVSELKRRSTVNTRKVDSSGRMSWAARVRQQRSQAASDGSDQ